MRKKTLDYTLDYFCFVLIFFNLLILVGSKY